MLNDLETRWGKVETSYEKLMLANDEEVKKEFKQSAVENFNASADTYYLCRSQLFDRMRTITLSTLSPSAENSALTTTSKRFPKQFKYLH